MSVPQSVFNVVNIMMGVGMLSLPYALKLTGWAIGGILFCLFGLLAYFSANLTVQCVDMCKRLQRTILLLEQYEKQRQWQHSQIYPSSHIQSQQSDVTLVSPSPTVVLCDSSPDGYTFPLEELYSPTSPTSPSTIAFPEGAACSTPTKNSAFVYPPPARPPNVSSSSNVSVVSAASSILPSHKPPIKSILTLSDIGEVAFGTIGKHVATTLFCFELFSAAVALLILFSMSFESLFPNLLSASIIRVWVTIALLPTVWTHSLSFLSTISSMGIATLVIAVLIMFYDGLSVKTSPGSLWEPAVTDFGPVSFRDCTAAIGLLFSSFDAHALYPSLYRGMSRPNKFNVVLRYSYLIVGSIQGFVAICGYRMFGRNVSQSFTSSLVQVPSYVPLLSQIVLFGIMLNPLSKFGLILQPIHHQVEYTLGIAPAVIMSGDGDVNTVRPYSVPILLSRTLVAAATLAISIALPEFSQVMGLLGSLLGITIAVTFPACCYLTLAAKLKKYEGKKAKLGLKDVGLFEPDTSLKTGLVITSIVVGVISAILGTYGSLSTPRGPSNVH